MAVHIPRKDAVNDIEWNLTKGLIATLKESHRS